jgi:hypothetical protein
MQPDLTDLRITSSQLEKLTGLDISDAFMGRIYRPSVFRSAHRLIPFLVTEAFTLAVVIIFCLPIGLVVGRGLGLLTSGNTTLFVLALLALAVLIFAGWNFYMWSQTKPLKTLAHLLDEVDKHNEIIAAVDLFDQLATVGQAPVAVLDREEVLKALAATRESLINALLTEKILRKHQRLMARRQELFSQIETNLATLQTLQINSQATEYGQLLNEALQIGLSIRRELESGD